MQIIKERTAAKVFPFIAYKSEKSEKPALIIHLHGAGERGNGGDDLEKVLLHGFPNIVNDQNLKNSVLVMPQCPEDTFWVAKIESIRTFIDEMIKEFDVNENRIYICGLSMGGFGTWSTAMAYPDLFAAIAPCCGGGMPWYAKSLKMPIRAFHGLEDTVVLPNQSIDMANALKDWHPDFKLTLYEGVGHDSWDKAFSEELLSWLLSKSK